ncbi:MAG: hypothetical protein DDT35_01408 [Firmicutes bacterium]|nr:hypothetical protein [Bacillota bacterium]
MEGDIITLQDIFVFVQTGRDPSGRISGEFKPTGIRPRFYEKLVDAHAQLPPDIFHPK